MLRVFVLVQFAFIQPLSHKIDLKKNRAGATSHRAEIRFGAKQVAEPGCKAPAGMKHTCWLPESATSCALFQQVVLAEHVRLCAWIRSTKGTRVNTGTDSQQVDDLPRLARIPLEKKKKKTRARLHVRGCKRLVLLWNRLGGGGVVWCGVVKGRENSGAAVLVLQRRSESLTRSSGA